MTAAPTEKAGAARRVKKASQRKASRRRQINFNAYRLNTASHNILKKSGLLDR